MKEKVICEQCREEFEYYVCKGTNPRRFCTKKCWYEWNAKNLASLNDLRFRWDKATKEEKLERLKMNYESHVIRKDGCWSWSGVVDKNGYGQIPCGYHKNTKAHRASWLFNNGEIISGMLVCHKCDNPPCTNPEHLFLGTHKDNNLDSIKKNRAVVGSRQPKAKLTEEDVKKIRELLKNGVKGRRIAKDFGVAPSQICNINKGISWKHVEVCTDV
jgi:hypothetical protein